MATRSHKQKMTSEGTFTGKINKQYQDGVDAINNGDAVYLVGDQNDKSESYVTTNAEYAAKNNLRMCGFLHGAPNQLLDASHPDQDITVTVVFNGTNLVKTNNPSEVFYPGDLLYAEDDGTKTVLKKYTSGSKMPTSATVLRKLGDVDLGQVKNAVDGTNAALRRRIRLLPPREQLILMVGLAAGAGGAGEDFLGELAKSLSASPVVGRVLFPSHRNMDERVEVYVNC